jgi:hypothetical protein
VIVDRLQVMRENRAYREEQYRSRREKDYEEALQREKELSDALKAQVGSCFILISYSYLRCVPCRGRRIPVGWPRGTGVFQLPSAVISTVDHLLGSLPLWVDAVGVRNPPEVWNIR